MAFKIAVTPSYRVKVIVELPNQHGKHDKNDFMAEFRRVTMEELDDLRKLPQREVLQSVLVGWSGLLDGDSQDVPFSPANMDSLLAIPPAFVATTESFWTSVLKAKEKN